MWKKWFPNYKIPKIVDDLVAAHVLVDKTRDTDVTPHFEATLAGGAVVLWVDHPSPASRFLPDGPRYMVQIYPTGFSKETLIETNNIDEAVNVLAHLLREGKGLRLL